MRHSSVSKDGGPLRAVCITETISKAGIEMGIGGRQFSSLENLQIHQLCSSGVAGYHSTKILETRQGDGLRVANGPDEVQFFALG